MSTGAQPQRSDRVAQQVLRQSLVLLALLVAPSRARAEEAVAPGSLAPGDGASELEQLMELPLVDLLDYVVVSATKLQQRVAAAPAIMSVVTEREIQERGYRSVAEALQSLPGFYLLNDHVTHNLGVRGVNGGLRASSRIVKVMIDGQPVSFRPSTENWLGEELIPIGAVRRIEVIRGPASALYGANAFLGVINIITKSGDDVDGVRLVALGNVVEGHPGGAGEIVMGKKSGDMHVLIAARESYVDRSGLRIRDVPGQEKYGSGPDRSRNDQRRPTSVFAKLGYASELLGELSLDFNYQWLHSKGEFQDWGLLPQGSQSGPSLDLQQQNIISLDNWYLRGRLTRELGKRFDLSVSAAISRMGQMSDDQLAINQAGLGDYFTRDVGTTGLDLTAELSHVFKETNVLIAGADLNIDWHRLLTYYAHTDEPRPLIEPLPRIEGEDLFANVGVYLQGVIYPFSLLAPARRDTLGLTAGLRFDHHNVYGSVLTYRAGAVYLRDKVWFKLLVGSSFKAPAPVQLYTGRFSIPGVLGNPDLRPEKALGLDALIGFDPLSSLRASANAFFTLVDDKVEFVTDPSTAQVRAQNVSEVRSFGVEATISYRAGTSGADLSASYQKSVSPRGVQGEDDDTALYPAVMVKATAHYAYPRFYLQGLFEGRYVSSRWASEQNARAFDRVNQERYMLGGYATFDLGLASYGLQLLGAKETRFACKIYNVLDTTYLYPGFRDYDIPSLGRTFWLSATQAW